MTEEVLLRPQDRVTRIVSDEFKFLKMEDDEDDDAEEKVVQESDKTNVKVAQNGLKNGVHYLTEVSNADKYKLNNKINKEFTIVTSVVNGTTDTNQNVVVETSAKDSENQFTIVTYTSGDKKKLDRLCERNINPVYEVSEEDSISLIETDKIANSVTSSLDGDGDDRNQVKEMDVIVRDSVLIEGEVVELRKSHASEESRQSKVATWRKNQKFVSEAFGFLKEEEFYDDGDVGPNQINDLDENNAEWLDSDNAVCRACGKKVDRSGNNCTVGNETMDSEQIPDVCLCNQSKSAEQNTGDVTHLENDSLGELPGKQRRKKLSHQSSSENGEEDGDSSDEDTGMYRESFRKSTWLYVGDNEEIKIGQTKSNYVSIADLGLKTCEDDDIFGNGPDIPEVPDSPLKKLGHQRKDSTSTTASEQEFRNQFKSVSRRFVKRANSQQEYKRFTARCYDNMKVVTLERNSNIEYGIHILDCKPAVITSVDPGSPSEKAGLRQGHIVTSINGVNVLESDHDDIITLVQDSNTLTIEVGCGDMSAVLDLQVPVHTGYLQKQVSSTIFKTWKKRFFILRRDNCLYYYKHEKEVDPLGAIPLSGYTFSRHGDHNKFGFKAEKYNSKTFYFLADSRDNMTSWVGVLNEAARDVRDKDSWMDVTASNVGLPALNIRNPDCSGYLYKVGRATRRWRKRYCILKDACIYHYKNANSKEADGVAHLHGYKVDPSGVSGKKFSFSLKPPEEQMRVFSFYTDNDTDKLRWVRSLNASIQKWVKVD